MTTTMTPLRISRSTAVRLLAALDALPVKELGDKFLYLPADEANGKFCALGAMTIHETPVRRDDFDDLDTPIVAKLLGIELREAVVIAAFNDDVDVNPKKGENKETPAQRFNRVYKAAKEVVQTPAID